jgi:uncharacterized protein
MTVHQLDRTQARRIAVRAQLLSKPRPTDLLAVVRHLTFVQLDPTAAIAPSADLVLWTRLGDSYRPEHLQQALEKHELYEESAMVRPIEDLALHLPEMLLAPQYRQGREWLAANESFHRDVLARLREAGPLLSKDIPDTSTVPWPSTGWTNNRNVTQMLEFLCRRGEVAINGRRGKQRLWDLPERVYPAGLPTYTREEAQRLRDERRLRALGIVPTTGTAAVKDPNMVGEAGEPAEVAGVPGIWRVDPAALGQPFTGRTALLSPFDRLVHDRVRLSALFEYEYILEMYKPAAKRRWGYFALPILHGDRLVGKLDATADRKAGMFRVNAIHQDVPFTRAIDSGVRAEIERLASWLGLTVG